MNEARGELIHKKFGGVQDAKNKKEQYQKSIFFRTCKRSYE
jgi:hypothetical protein